MSLSLVMLPDKVVTVFIRKYIYDIIIAAIYIYIVYTNPGGGVS